MRINKKVFLKTIIILVLFLVLNDKTILVSADAVSDSVNEQLNNLDLSALENFFNSINTFNEIGFASYLNSILNGDFVLDYGAFFSLIIKIIFDNVTTFMPTFISIIAISIFSAIIKQVRSSLITDSVAEIAFYVCACTIAVLLLGQLINIFTTAKIIIENIAIFTEIMSPIILTLMLAVGGNVSATVYKPTVAFLSNGVINVALYVLFPLIVLITVFSLASNFSDMIKFNKFSDLVGGIIKWIIGITATVFGSFLSIQGITSACYDGISLKATKYAVSNSIPLIGGFIKDGFDLIIAGSVIIKHAVGLSCVIGLFFILLSPILSIATFSITLKLASAIIDSVADARLANFCTSITKSLGYVTAVLLLVGFMFFITVLLMVFSANAFL